MVKKYPLKIEQLRVSDGNYISGYYSRGVHQPQAFLDAYRATPREVPEWFKHEITLSDIRIEWWRVMPTGEDYSSVYHKANYNSRGAFPITEVNFSDIDMQRVIDSFVPEPQS